MFKRSRRTNSNRGLAHRHVYYKHRMKIANSTSKQVHSDVTTISPDMTYVHSHTDNNGGHHKAIFHREHKQHHSETSERLSHSDISNEHKVKHPVNVEDNQDHDQRNTLETNSRGHVRGGSGTSISLGDHLYHTHRMQNSHANYTPEVEANNAHYHGNHIHSSAADSIDNPFLGSKNNNTAFDLFDHSMHHGNHLGHTHGNSIGDMSGSENHQYANKHEVSSAHVHGHHHHQGMKMFFSLYTDGDFLVKGLHINTIAGIVLGMLTVMIMTMTLEVLVLWVQRREKRRCYNCLRESRAHYLSVIAIGAIMKMVTTTGGYVIMLAVMSMNAWILVATVMGAGLGHLFIRPWFREQHDRSVIEQRVTGDVSASVRHGNVVGRRLAMEGGCRITDVRVTDEIATEHVQCTSCGRKPVI